MSNPTELPDLDGLLANHSSAVINYAEHGDIGSYYNDLVGAENAIRELVARRAQPEGEAPQAKPICKVCGADVALNGETCGVCFCKPAATLSPLCGAQHAESGKESTWECRRYCKGDAEWTEWRAIDAKEYERRKNDSAFEFRALAAQQAAAPGTLEKSARALVEKWHKDAVDTGFATSEAAVELLEVLDAATSAPGTPEAPKGGG